MAAQQQAAAGSSSDPRDPSLLAISRRTQAFACLGAACGYSTAVFTGAPVFRGIAGGTLSSGIAGMAVYGCVHGVRRFAEEVVRVENAFGEEEVMGCVALHGLGGAIAGAMLGPLHTQSLRRGVLPGVAMFGAIGAACGLAEKGVEGWRVEEQGRVDEERKLRGMPKRTKGVPS